MQAAHRAGRPALRIAVSEGDQLRLPDAAVMEKLCQILRADGAERKKPRMRALRQKHEAAGIRMEPAFLPRFTGGASQEYYPEVFPYTFPDRVTTVRLPTPAQSRYTLTYGLAFGFRNEMEVRYAADRRYVENGVVPAPADYGNVLGPPSFEVIREAGDPAEAVQYYKQVLTFQKDHGDLFLEGRFLSNRDVVLEASSPSVLANAFRSSSSSKDSGAPLGVLVWNVSEEPVSYKVSVPGYRMAGICAPDREVAPGDSLAGQSVHLLLLEKDR